MDLLALQDLELVNKTDLSRKLTLGGLTRPYPVYRIRLDLLFYNDRNDRIATWITQYQNDNENRALTALSQEEYNKVIERFIIDSNPSSIEKTKNNIAMVGQREPGVVLADGRIIDGNRRFTCLRLLHEEDPSINYIESVILPSSVDQKNIKMLELSIQHGEEQRVDYNLIDLAIGTYHDIVQTNLLSVSEYASSTNETEAEIRRRIAVAKMIIEFLEFMKVPGQYHIAREMQVYSLFYEAVPLLKRLDDPQKQNAFKRSLYTNTMLETFADQRKYIRDVRALMESNHYESYIRKQNDLLTELDQQKQESGIHNENELKLFIKEHQETREDLKDTMDQALYQSKKSQVKSRPAQIVSKSISLLMDLDTKVVESLSEGEKDKLNSQLKKLSNTTSLIRESAGLEKSEIKVETEQKNEYRPAVQSAADPYVCCVTSDYTITNLSFSLSFRAFISHEGQKTEADYIACFVDPNHKEICPIQEFHVFCGETTPVRFVLNSSATALNECFLVLRATEDAREEVRSLTRFKMKFAFVVSEDF